MDALRMAAGSVSLGVAGDSYAEALALVARLPTIVAAYWRLLGGEEPVAPDPRLGHAANYLYMLTGEEPGAEEVRALETYLNTVADHGMNASTFAARVIISTRSDVVSAVVGAIGALKGPLHGARPDRRSRWSSRSERQTGRAVLREKLERGERLMGFGHRIYKVRDPRADVLAAAAERLYATDGDGELYRLALESRRRRWSCSPSTSRAGICRPTSSSTRRCCCMGSGCTRAILSDVRRGKGRGVDGALLRAAGAGPSDPAAVGVRRSEEQALGADRGAIKATRILGWPGPDPCRAGWWLPPTAQLPLVEQSGRPRSIQDNLLPEGCTEGG